MYKKERNRKVYNNQTFRIIQQQKTLNKKHEIQAILKEGIPLTVFSRPLRTSGSHSITPYLLPFLL